MSIKIIIFNQPPIYPGTLLTGEVRCSFSSHTDVRSIKIRCYGKEHTEWRTGGKNSHTYRGTHNFFQMETKLYEPANNDVAPGNYTYPFQFLLPPDIPSTFEFPYGYIRYSLKGIIDIPLAIDPRERIDLAVISVLDLSSLPSNMRQPYQTSDQALMGCCWCFNSEPVHMTGQINKLAFIPGESIKINMQLQNMSSDNVVEVIVKLVRCFVAHSEEPRHDTRFINEDLLVKTSPGVGAHGKRDYDVDLFIPTDMPIPNLTNCQLLEGIYRIDIVGKTSGLNRDLNWVIAEIKIGHVDGTNWRSPDIYPQSSSQTAGYPYPTSSNGGNSWSVTKQPTPNIGFVMSTDPTAPPPGYEDVTQELLKR